jgi:tetratricopeptide (TPR) repeat protein
VISLDLIPPRLPLGALFLGLTLLQGPLLESALPGLPLAALRPAEGSELRAMHAVEAAANDPDRLTSQLALDQISFSREGGAQEGFPDRRVEGLEPPRETTSGDSTDRGARSRPLARGVSEREAELAMRVGDHVMAAEIYARIVDQSPDEERRKQALLSLAEVYRAMDDPMRVVSILERFKQEHPDDDRMPEVLLRLGFLYREVGVPQQSVDAFFGVLKQSFRLEQSNLQAYREITNEASYQIAETYYRMHQYELAAEFFSRLLRAARPGTPERLDLLAKCAYSNYFAGDYRRVLFLLELKDWGSIDANRQAEFRFLRASAYWSLRDQQRARAEVVNLADLEVEPNKDPYWNFWWKFVGNELANDLFAQEDYAMAHKLYYSLLHLSGEARWQLPIIYQIGRCREYMGAPGEAREIYERILEEIEGFETSALEGTLIVLQTRVSDQLKNLAWEQELSRARNLYDPSLTQGTDATEPLASLDARGG